MTEQCKRRGEWRSQLRARVKGRRRKKMIDRIYCSSGGTVHLSTCTSDNDAIISSLDFCVFSLAKFGLSDRTRDSVGGFPERVDEVGRPLGVDYDDDSSLWRRDAATLHCGGLMRWWAGGRASNVEGCALHFFCLF